MNAVTANHTKDRLGRNYHRLFSAATISNLGDGVALVAYPWLASAITRNPLLISLIVVVQRLPWLLFALPAGVLTDRHDRRQLMIVANTARGAIVDEAERRNSEIIVMGAPRQELIAGQRAVFGHTVDHVLRHAPCRVMVTASDRIAYQSVDQFALYLAQVPGAPAS